MKKFAKPSTPAFVIKASKTSEFFASKPHTSSEILARANKHIEKAKNAKK